MDIHTCFMLPIDPYRRYKFEGVSKEKHKNNRVMEKKVWETLAYTVQCLVFSNNECAVFFTLTPFHAVSFHAVSLELQF